MFSTVGISAVIRTDGFNWAIARIAPSTAAPPPMSYFIFSMPSAGLMETPPVSNVTPFPMSPRWSAEFAFSGTYRMMISAGGLSLPWATPSNEPIPICRIRPSSRISHSSPNSAAIFSACSASTSGVSRLAGSFFNSRLKFCASATIRPRCTASAETRGALRHAERERFDSLLVLFRIGLQLIRLEIAEDCALNGRLGKIRLLEPKMDAAQRLTFQSPDGGRD